MQTNFTIPKFYFLIVCLTILLAAGIFGQSKEFIGIKVLTEDGKSAFQTIPAKNNSTVESRDEHLFGKNSFEGEKFVLGGTVLWSFQDAAAIANSVALNNIGNSALCAWTLNQKRVSLYTEVNNTPVWEFPTGQYDPVVDISDDGSVVAATVGTNFYLLDNVTGNIDYQFALPDSFYASAVSVSRDGSMVVFLANALGNSITSRAYA